jgi:hypothetical protein
LVESARSGCPINAAVEAFGDRWSLLVLRDVMFGNRRYFRELLADSEEGIASNILADRALCRWAGGVDRVHGRAADHPSRRISPGSEWPERHETLGRDLRRRNLRPARMHSECAEDTAAFNARTRIVYRDGRVPMTAPRASAVGAARLHL